MSQMSRKLLRHGVVREQAHAGDNRRRLLVLAPKGAAMMKRMEPVWTAISAAVDQLNITTHVDFVAAVTTLDGALGDRPFARRIDASLRHRDARHVQIIPSESRYAADFKRLNVEWLEKYFTVEPIDEKVLSDPEAAILRPGGGFFWHGSNVRSSGPAPSSRLAAAATSSPRWRSRNGTKACISASVC